MTLSEETRFAFKKTIPILTGYGFLGMAFGLMLQNKGYSFLWAFLISSVIYAGSMQFVLVTILASGMGLPGIILLTLSVNSRHIFYGLPFLKTFRDMGKRFFYMVFSLTDETYALLCSTDIPPGLDRDLVYFRIALFNQIYWILGSTLGALTGALVNLNLQGIEFSMTALFAVILTDQWLAAKLPGRLAALLGLLCGIAALLFFGPNRFVLPALLASTALLVVFRPFFAADLSEKEPG